MLLALALAATLSPTWAQPAADGGSPGWTQGPSLTGDWGGLRSRLAEQGLTPYGTYSSEAFGATGRGVSSGADWTSELEVGLDVDAQKLVGLRGGPFTRASSGSRAPIRATEWAISIGSAA